MLAVEQTWRDSEIPTDHLVYVFKLHLQARRLRLWLAGCARVREHSLLPVSREALDIGERFADGMATRAELESAHKAVWEEFHALDTEARARDEDLLVLHAQLEVRGSGSERLAQVRRALSEIRDRFSTVVAVAYATDLLARGVTRYSDSYADTRMVGEISFPKGEHARRLLHDVFCNPFRPVTFSPEWCTSTAVALASQMYESRNFGAMPILADALQDAGCDNPDVLEHCRGPGPHARGCWVVDLVLNKG